MTTNPPTPTRLGDLTLLHTVRLRGKLHWVCLCACGEETTISAFQLKVRKVMACKRCVDAKFREAPRNENTCSICRSDEHNRSNCPQRGERKYLCPSCAGLAHRAVAPKCRTCGTRYAPLVNEIALETRVGNWSWLT